MKQSRPSISEVPLPLNPLPRGEGGKKVPSSTRGVRKILNLITLGAAPREPPLQTASVPEKERSRPATRS